MSALSTTRPAASLSSGLLARKGQARPAMRSQNLVTFGQAGALDDLGWNDMGAVAPPAPVPEVLVARERLQAEVARPPAPEPTAPAPPVPALRAAGPKAAFTLRLDAERHLRLRLASASANRSAQALVTDALDQFLAARPEVEGLAARLRGEKGE